MIDDGNKIIRKISALITIGWVVININPSVAESTADSLWAAYNDENLHDSMRIEAISNLAWEIMFSVPDSARKIAHLQLDYAGRKQNKKWQSQAYNTIGVTHAITADCDKAIENYEKSLNLDIETGNKKGISASYGNIGIIHKQQGNLFEALKFFNKGLKIELEIQDKNRLATSFINIGTIYNAHGLFPEALKWYHKNLKIVEELDDLGSRSAIYNNIGNLYINQGNYELANDWFQKSLKIDEELGNKVGVAACLVNIGFIQFKLEKLEEAMPWYKRGLELYEALGDKHGIAAAITNIGAIYHEKGEYARALESYYKSLEMKEAIGDDIGVMISLYNLGMIHIAQGEIMKGIEKCERGFNMAVKAGIMKSKIEQCQCLSTGYEKLGDFEKSLEYYKNYAASKDSIFNEDKSKDIGKLEAKYEFERAEAENKRMEEEKAKQYAAQESRRNNLQYSGILIFLVLIFALVFMLGKFSIPIRIAEGMIFFAFLLFFEFTLVLLDPYIEQYSSGAPAIKLGFNAVLAALIFPLHSLFEAKLKGRLVK
ncbi:MAG: tetratricopeptide repeat protein [Flavobacteriales bacterium]|nr:tetratricopeptide repeat protein [Flavobacteriales bacterium]